MKKILVVLGKRLNNDGSFQQEMHSRCNAAAYLLTNQIFDIAILSGGLANRKAGITEARAMYNYLTAKGVDSQKLILEEKSKTTRQNAKFSVPLLLNYNIEKAYICSSFSHLKRPINNPLVFFKYFFKRKKRRICIEAIPCENHLNKL